MLAAVPDPKLTLCFMVKRAIEYAYCISWRELWVICDRSYNTALSGKCPSWRHRPDASNRVLTSMGAIIIPVNNIGRSINMSITSSIWLMCSVIGKNGVCCAITCPVQHTSSLRYRIIPVIQNLSAHRILFINSCHSASHEESSRPDRKTKAAIAGCKPGNKLANFSDVNTDLLLSYI